METRDTTVANTILQQLGGSKFKMMTGAHSFSADKDSLTFKIPSAKKNGVKAVKITLTPSDTYNTYTVTFYSIKFKPFVKVEVVSKHEDIYCEDLQQLFTQETGLYTHL